MAKDGAAVFNVTSPMLKRLRKARQTAMRALRPRMDRVYKHMDMTPVEKRAHLNLISLELVNQSRIALNKGILDDTVTMQARWRAEIEKEKAR